MAPADYVKVLASFDSNIDNPLLTPASVALFFAGSGSLPLDGGVSGAVTTAVDATTWPTRGDLFPTLGIASFCEIAGTCPDEGDGVSAGCSTSSRSSIPAALLLLALAITLPPAAAAGRPPLDPDPDPVPDPAPDPDPWSYPGSVDRV